ncbi:MAG: putative Ig domain-containing protein [Sedimentisphaerales bacterium]|nr:putative Ig domain-containing protein [Sedimentisphaerales bacterium]
MNKDSDITFTIIPDPGYVVKNIKTAGISEGAATSFTYYLVRSDYTLDVVFIAQADNVPETIYVDGSLSLDCLNGEYSITNRDNSGSDGNAYTSITEACDVAGPGDTVLIRGGTYNKVSSAGIDVLWPKHSGTAQNPIRFKPYNNEVVVIGDDPAGAWPNDYISIMRGVITMRNVHYIEIDGLTIRQVGGWLFARDCGNITIENCTFELGMYGPKGGARFIECDYVNIRNNRFLKSSYDSLILVGTTGFLIENNVFNTSGHALLALRGASYNVVRGNRFDNYIQKMVEVYDQKLDTRDSSNPAYVLPRYNDTKRNVFEDNFFGFTTDLDYGGSRYSALQFSGQDTIVRNNVFSNPHGVQCPDANYNVTSAGVAIYMRWGGSWYGWNPKLEIIQGEAHEAGYVTGNRFYHNTFYGYDGGKVTVPVNNSMGSTPNPPPMKNVQDYLNHPFSDYYAFADNKFKNNIFTEGTFVAHSHLSSHVQNAGNPLQILLSGRTDETHFENNNFFSSGSNANKLIYNQLDYPYQDAKAPNFYNTNHTNWSGNVQQDPLYVNAANNDFHLQAGSSMIDAGEFLTSITSPSGSGSQITVEDAGYFYDGYDIIGEQGDLIKLESGQTARIIDIDYSIGNNIITLDHQVSWSNGEKISLIYFGAAPDIGAYESIPSNPNNPSPVLQTIGDKSVNVNVILTFDVNATDPDSELITYTVQNLPQGASFINQIFSWTPNYTQAGNYQVRFIASDGNSKVYETITITVNDVNRAPILGIMNY